MAQFGGFLIMGVIVAIITVAIGTSIGMALIGKTDSVIQTMDINNWGTYSNQTTWGRTTPEAAFNSTVTSIYSSWPLLGIVVLALIGAAALLAISVFR